VRPVSPWIAAVVALATIGCKPSSAPDPDETDTIDDSDVDTDSDTDVAPTARLSLTVWDPSGARVPGVTVSAGDVQVTTADDGVAQLTLPTTDRPVVLQLDADGIAPTVRTLPDLLTDRAAEATVLPEAVATLSGDGVRTAVADGLVLTLDGTLGASGGPAPEGLVALVAVADTLAERAALPATAAGLLPLRAATVSFRDNTGPVAFAGRARLAWPAPAGLDLDDVVLAHLDETTGAWTEEGTLWLEGGALVAEVSHFTTWAVLPAPSGASCLTVGLRSRLRRGRRPGRPRDRYRHPSRHLRLRRRRHG
jgi:hypothetical protein